ncbi:MAG TPA: MFS transporter [Stellaceae bacterium]|nr:MFS transporter [Stellaceae bacterium]
MPDDSPRPTAADFPARVLGRFLIARLASALAWQMQGVALGWYVYALTNSAFDLGLIGLVQFVPFAGLVLIAGHAVDRFPRRMVVTAALAGDSLCSVAIALLALTGGGRSAPVFVAIAGYGACRAFEQPAWQSWLPGLVAAETYPRAAAWNSLASQFAVILGPALGGVLYLLGPPVPFVCAALLQLLALVAAASLRSRSAGVSEPLSWDSMLDGVRFIARNEAVRGAISLDLFAVLFGGATALLPIFARDILATGPAGLGLLRSAPAAGALITGFILTRHPPGRGVGPRIFGAVAVYGVATLVFGLSRTLWLSLAGLFFVGAADMLSVVIRQTLVQVASPNAIRGRVTSVNSLFTGTSNQLGQFESGVTAAWFGPVASVVLGGVATLAVVALWARWFPGLRRMDGLPIAPEPMDMLSEPVSGSLDSI